MDNCTLLFRSDTCKEEHKESFSEASPPETFVCAADMAARAVSCPGLWHWARGAGQSPGHGSAQQPSHVSSTGLYGAGSFGVAVSAPLFCWPLQQSLFFGEGSLELSRGMKPSSGLAEASLLLPGEASLGNGRHLDRVTVWERAWEELGTQVLAVTYLGTTSLLSQILSSIWACSSLGSWGSCSLWQDLCEP